MSPHTRYSRQHALEGVGEAGQKLFFSTEVVCEGEGPVLQTAAAYLEAAGFCLSGRVAHCHPGFWPSAWQAKAGNEPCPRPLPTAAPGCRQRGFLGQLPCACPDGVDFWVLMGCFRSAPGFLFARGQNQKPFLDAQLAALKETPKEQPPLSPAVVPWTTAPPESSLPSSAFAPLHKNPYTPGPAYFVVAAWAALVFEKLALGLGPEAGGGSIGPLGEAELWEAP
jgi:hypothetical protein